MWHPVHPVLESRCPYLAVVVETEPYPNARFIGNLLGDVMQDVIIGTKVVGVFEDHAEGTVLNWATPTVTDPQND